VRGSIRMSTVLLATAALFACGWSGASAATPYPTSPSPTSPSPTSPSPTSPSPTGSCTGTGIQVVSFQAAPATVAPGQLTTGTLTLRNCTGQAQQLSTTWYGRFTGATTGFPPGCPAIDPLPRPVSLGVGAVASVSGSYLAPTSCSATGLDLIAQFTPPGSTGSIISTTHVTITAATPTCSVQFQVRHWWGGFGDDVTLTNSGSAPINGWRLSFTFPGDQKVTQYWSAMLTQTGATVSATGQSWNANLPAGGSAWFGFFGTMRNGGPDTPTNVTLNGAPCLVQVHTLS
jgi:hypothetical protein